METENDRPKSEPFRHLVVLGRQLRNKINLEKIESQLQSDDIDDRIDSVIFTISHLLYSGAIAEERIICYLKQDDLPDWIIEHPDFNCYDKLATLRAWKGTSFDNTINIIGSLSFLVSIMFFFESFVKLVIEKRENRVVDKASEVANWIDSNIGGSSRVEAIRFLNEYRNSWHAFGRHKQGKKEQVWHELKLVAGERVPVPTRAQSMELLTEVVEAVIEINNLRSQGQA